MWGNVVSNELPPIPTVEGMIERKFLRYKEFVRENVLYQDGHEVPLVAAILTLADELSEIDAQR